MVEVFAAKSATSLPKSLRESMSEFNMSMTFLAENMDDDMDDNMDNYSIYNQWEISRIQKWFGTVVPYVRPYFRVIFLEI